MRAVVQRVANSSVTVDGKVVGRIGRGVLVLLGVTQDDNDADIAYMIDKTLNMRIFEDENEKMNLSLLDLGLEILVVSQFTLFGDVRKGRRPSFTNSASATQAKVLYEKFVEELKITYDSSKIATGVFQADMKVSLLNDGPVTIMLDSKRLF